MELNPAYEKGTPGRAFSIARRPLQLTFDLGIVERDGQARFTRRLDARPHDACSLVRDDDRGVTAP